MVRFQNLYTNIILTWFCKNKGKSPYKYGNYTVNQFILKRS